MPSPEHEAYRNQLAEWIREHAHEPDVVEQLELHAELLLVLWHLDLGPAREILARCYAPSPRGGDPWDPLVMLRCMLMAVLLGQTSLNAWPRELAGSHVLRKLAGIPEHRGRPGVGTLYDLMHRLHDGPVRCTCEHCERPSVAERRRSRTPRERTRRPERPKSKKKGEEKHPRRARAEKRAAKRAEAKTPAAQRPAKLGSATEQLVRTLDAAESQGNPFDLLGRPSDLLMNIGVMESARRGLLGDLGSLVAGGDGSPLRTGANRYGRRTCSHTFSERCDCPRLFSDPDATWGSDSHRETYYFGHRFYEVSVSTQGHDLPLGLRLDPANTSEFLTSLHTIDHVRKARRKRDPDARLGTAVLDAGHDGEPIHRYCRYCIDRDIQPIIPLKQAAPAVHPARPDVPLSKRGVPECQGDVEMTAWGTAGAGRTVFICPVKAKRLDRCPLAPDDEPGWVCRPDQKVGPTRIIKVDHNPRLCPPVPRNTSRFRTLYDLRSGTERSNAVKKETFRLEAARHRRASFWLIRLHLCALLQHAKAWVAGLDARALLDELLGHGQEMSRAA